MGYDTGAASAAQLEGMKSLVARSMEEGAWGLVTRFSSGGPAHPRETIALARVVASYGGNDASHIGSEGFEQEKEIDFAIRVAEEARILVQVHNTHSFERPKSYPEGIPYVLVNGVLVIDQGRYTTAHPGQVIYGKG